MNKQNSDTWISPGAATATIAVGTKLRQTINETLECYDGCLADIDFYNFCSTNGLATLAELCRGKEFLNDLSCSQLRLHLARVTGAQDALQLVRALILFGEALPDRSALEDLLVMLLEVHQVRILEPAHFAHLDDEGNITAKNVILRFWKTGKSGRGTFLSGWEAVVFFSFLTNRMPELLPAWRAIALSLDFKTHLFRDCLQHLYSDSPGKELHRG